VGLGESASRSKQAWMPLQGAGSTLPHRCTDRDSGRKVLPRANPLDVIAGTAALAAALIAGCLLPPQLGRAPTPGPAFPRSDSAPPAGVPSSEPADRRETAAPQRGGAPEPASPGAERFPERGSGAPARLPAETGPLGDEHTERSDIYDDEIPEENDPYSDGISEEDDPSGDGASKEDDLRGGGVPEVRDPNGDEFSEEGGSYDESTTARLLEAASRDLAVADSLVHAGALRPLAAPARDRLESAWELSRQARRAADRGDAVVASELAARARSTAAEALRP